jgi:hypothetical protein
VSSPGLCHTAGLSLTGRSETKRSAQPDANVDWKGVAYDLKDVDWSTVKYTAGFGAPAATPAAEQKKPDVAAAPTPVVEAANVKPSAVVVATPSKVADKPAKSSAAAASSTKASSVGDLAGKLVSNVLNGVASLAADLKCKVGKNEHSETNGVGIWIGTDSKWGMDVTNSGSEFAIWYCWKHNNAFTGQFINDNVPDISVGLDPGEMVQLSFADNQPAACAPAKKSSTLGWGMLDDTWAEVTFAQQGKFDVSKNPNMHGTAISMVGEECVSDMNTCYFACKDGPTGTEPSKTIKSCQYDYDLFGRGRGCGGDYDPGMKGTGGGCEIKDGGERLKVTFG